MRPPEGTRARLLKPSASTNVANPDDTPIQPEGAVGVLGGPFNGSDTEWRRMAVSNNGSNYVLAVRTEGDWADVVPLLDGEHDGDVDDDLEDEEE